MDLKDIIYIPVSWSTRFLNRSLRSEKIQSSKPPFLYQLVTLHLLIFYILVFSFHSQKSEIHWPQKCVTWLCTFLFVLPTSHYSNSIWKSVQLWGGWSTSCSENGPNAAWSRPGQSSRSVPCLSDWFRDGYVTRRGVVRVNLQISTDNIGTKTFASCHP